MSEVVAVVSMMDAYRTAADVLYPVHPVDKDVTPLFIAVHKLGGGALDKAHAGTWIVEVVYGGELLWSSGEIDSGTPHTHYQVAMMVADSLAAEVESGESMFWRDHQNRFENFCEYLDV